MCTHHRYSAVNTLIHLYTSWSGTRHIRDIFTSVTIIFITMNTGKEEGKPQVTVSLILFYIRDLYGPRLIHSWLLSPHTLLLHRHRTYLCTVLIYLLYTMSSTQILKPKNRQNFRKWFRWGFNGAKIKKVENQSLRNPTTKVGGHEINETED